MELHQPQFTARQRQDIAFVHHIVLEEGSNVFSRDVIVLTAKVVAELPDEGFCANGLAAVDDLCMMCSLQLGSLFLIHVEVVVYDVAIKVWHLKHLLVV